LAFAAASAEQMTKKSDLRDEFAPIISELLAVKGMVGWILAAVMTILFLLLTPYIVLNKNSADRYRSTLGYYP
jgi:hypothetical protein